MVNPTLSTILATGTTLSTMCSLHALDLCFPVSLLTTSQTSSSTNALAFPTTRLSTLTRSSPKSLSPLLSTLALLPTRSNLVSKSARSCLAWGKDVTNCLTASTALSADVCSAMASETSVSSGDVAYEDDAEEDILDVVMLLAVEGRRDVLEMMRDNWVTNIVSFTTRTADHVRILFNGKISHRRCRIILEGFKTRYLIYLVIFNLWIKIQLLNN